MNNLNLEQITELLNKPLSKEDISDARKELEDEFQSEVIELKNFDWVK